MSIFSQLGHTVPSLATKLIRDIEADETVPCRSTGTARYNGDEVESVRWGWVLSKVTWTTDRGNWMWDGVLAMLRAMGVDTNSPL